MKEPKPIRPLQILHDMANQKARQKYIDAGVDPDYSAPKKFKVNNANSLTKAIKTFLILSGHQCERISTTGRVIDERQTYTDVLGHLKQIGRMRYIPGTVTRGSADLSSIIRRPGEKYGISVKIEVKWNKDRISSDQKIYCEAVEKAGGVYIIAKDFDSFHQWYTDFMASGQ